MNEWLAFSTKTHTFVEWHQHSEYLKGANILFFFFFFCCSSNAIGMFSPLGLLHLFLLPEMFAFSSVTCITKSLVLLQGFSQISLLIEVLNAINTELHSATSASSPLLHILHFTFQIVLIIFNILYNLFIMLIILSLNPTIPLVSLEYKLHKAEVFFF